MTVEETLEKDHPRVNSETGEIDFDQEAWEELQNASPQYSLVPVPKKMNVNPGDPIKIDLFINGYGKVHKNKLQVNYPLSNFITDEDEKGEIVPSISPSDDDPHALFSTEFSNQAGIPAVQHPIKEWGVTTPIPPESFSPVELSDDIEPPDYLYPVLASEISFAERPFLAVKLDSSENADPGNYPILFTFTYGDGENVFQDQKVSVIHINNTREQYEPWVTRAGVLVVIIALISLVIQGWNVLVTPPS